MKLRISLPSGIFLEEDVEAVIAEGGHGKFCLLPRHIDMTTVLVPGLFSYRIDGTDTYLAVDRGVLVKQGSTVNVAARAAVAGELGFLEKEVRRMLEEIDEQERITRSAVAKMEADFVRRFMEFGRL